MIPPVGSIFLGAVLVLVQLLAAVPWLALAFLRREDWLAIRRQPFAPWVLQPLGFALAVVVLAPLAFLFFVQDREALEVSGRVYAALLQVQLTLDAFILGFGLLLWLWPKGGAVALAAFREGVRQWLFWLLALLAAGAMLVSIVIPYFTFGEDYLMVKQLGYDVIMLAAVLFGALTASMSISEEIEGRTAVTLMSKPVSRRQFLLGKYAGIVLAGLFMFGLLGSYFEGVLLVKHWWDKLGPLSEIGQVKESSAAEGVRIGVVATPPWVTGPLHRWALAGPSTDFLRGVGQWLAHSLDTLPGLVLSFSQVLVLVALAVSLATRVPMVVNLVAVLVVYFLAHLTPVLVSQARVAARESPDSPAPRLLGFVTQVFDTFLPDLGSFRLNPALLSDTPPDPGLFTRYVASVTFYGVVYTVIVLLFGLILFEDRDLA
jgi:hypothetical protein